MKKHEVVRYIPGKCKYVCEGKQISNKIGEGRTAFKEHLGIV